MQAQEQFSAFDGVDQFSVGTLSEVTQQVRKRLASIPDSQILVFSQSTGRQTDIDLNGPVAGVSHAAPPAPAPGRPRLGVVGREVTLLPRHWEWLNSQSGGASVALRKLVEIAMRENVEKDSMRARHEAAYRFMTAMAGDFPAYEEALRSLFANDQVGLRSHIEGWPEDIKRMAMELAFPKGADKLPMASA